jgi:hypothetical protein
MLNSPQAQTLRSSLAVAGEALEKARHGYQDACATFEDTNGSDDGRFALRREGRAYAQAVTQFSDAAMAWLSFVDKQLQHILPETTSRRRTKPSGVMCNNRSRNAKSSSGAIVRSG